MYRLITAGCVLAFESGGLPGEIMPDYLHLSARGYEIWGKALKGDLEKLVK